MKKWNRLVVTAFLLTTALLVTNQFIRTKALRTGVIDTARVELEQAKLKQKVKNIKIYALVKLIGATSLFLSLCSGAAIFALVYYRRHNVHEQTIGESTIKMKYHDLSKLVPVCVQLAECEQLKASSPQHYISELIGLMAEHRKYLQAVFPHQLDKGPEIALPAYLPTFQDLFSKGEFSQPGSFVLGTLLNGTLKRVNRGDFISCAFGGESGSGKTSTLRNVVSQVALQGDMQIYIIDPQEGHPDSLSSSLGPLLTLPYVIAFNRLEIKQGVSELLSMIERRKTGQEPCDQVILIIFDEVGELIRGCPAVKRLIDEVGSRTRKFNVFGLFSTQSWPAKLFDGSEVRDNLVLTMAHKMKKRQAQTLFDDSSIAKRVSHLRQGQLIGRGQSFDETEVINVPYCSSQDVNEVYRKCQQSLPVDQIDHPEINDIDLIDRMNLAFQNSPEYTKKQWSIDHEVDPGFLSKILGRKKNLPPLIQQKFEEFLT